MRKPKCILAVLMLVSLSPLETAAQQGFYSSKPADDVRVIVASIDKMAIQESAEHDVPGSEEMLLFGFTTMTNQDCEIGWPLNREYLCTVELRDGAGNYLPKTSKGAHYGTQFSRFALSKSKLEYKRISPDQGPTWELFRPTEVFKIKQPGNYTLRLQFQVMKVEATPTNGFAKIVRLPVVELPVHHSGARKVSVPNGP